MSHRLFRSIIIGPLHVGRVPVKTVNAFSFLGLASILAGVLIPIDSYAQAANPSRGPVPFEVYDADGDGAISEAEFNRVREQRMAGRPGGGMGAPDFSRFDLDSDGRLSREELEAGRQANRASRTGGGPGMGSMGRNMPGFEDFDLDGNGSITETEFYEARAKRASERAEQGYRMKNLGSMPSFGDIDTDGNGIISPDEFAGHQLQHRSQ